MVVFAYCLPAQKNPGCSAALAGEHPGSLYDQLRRLLEQPAFFQCYFAGTDLVTIMVDLNSVIAWFEI